MILLKPLKEIVTFRGGGTPSKSKSEYWGGDIPWASVKDFKSTILTETKDSITEEGLNNSSANLIPKGHVIIPTRMALGKAAINTLDLAINQDLRALIPKIPIHTEYLLYAVLSLKDKIEGRGSGATVKGITQEELYALQIPLPPLAEQIRIATLLGKVETLIAQRKHHLTQLDDLLKSIFLQTFGDPVTNEKGWERKPLGKLGKTATGNTPSRLNPKNYESKHIEWIKTDNISSDSLFVTQAEEYLSELGSKIARIASPNTLLVACIAGSLKSIGRSALTNRTVAFNQQINSIQPNKEINPLFLYALFKLCRPYIQNHASDGMKKILKKSSFSSIQIIVPPPSLQNHFAAIVEKVEALKTRYEQSLADLETLYTTLSHHAFNGTLDLSRMRINLPH